MPKSTSSLLALFLTACPALPGTDTEGPATSDNDTTTSGEVDASSSAGSTYVRGTTLEITSLGTSDTGDTGTSGAGALAPDLSCKPTPLFCQQFQSWCPFAIDQASCDAVATPCEEQTSLCKLCDEVKVACLNTWGEGSPLCDLGHSKCLAAAPVEGCGCQPATFPCVADEAQCEAGWKFQPNGGYCMPPCAEALPVMDGPDGVVTTTDASTGPVIVTGGPDSSSGEMGSTTGSDSDTGSTGEPELDGPCGPSNYATCEEGFCTPHILVFCL